MGQVRDAWESELVFFFWKPLNKVFFSLFSWNTLGSLVTTRVISEFFFFVFLLLAAVENEKSEVALKFFFCWKWEISWFFCCFFLNCASLFVKGFLFAKATHFSCEIEKKVFFFFLLKIAKKLRGTSTTARLSSFFCFSKQDFFCFQLLLFWWN